MQMLVLSTTIDAEGGISLPALPKGNGSKVEIEKLVIRNGTIVINDPARQRSTEINGIAFDGNADSLSGPVKGQGRFTRFSSKKLISKFFFLK